MTSLVHLAGPPHKPYLSEKTSPTMGEEEARSTQDLQELTNRRRKTRAGAKKRRRKQKEAMKKLTRKETNIQQHITDFTNTKPPEEQGSGHTMEEKTHPEDLRVFLQNPNGVKTKGAYYEDSLALKLLKDKNVDIIALL